MLEELRLDRSFLESLTTNELIKLADSHGIDVPPGLDRVIVIEELLEATGEPAESVDKKNFLPLAEKHQNATAPLPRQYNITFIEVLIRDPLWAFAFWEVNIHDKEIHEKAPDFGGYYLRVVSNQSFAADSSLGDNSFTVQVGAGDSAWYLGFPPSGGSFTVELCVIRKEEPIILAVSKPFRLPNLLESLENKGSQAAGNPLLHLSGIDDLKILRNTLRSSRLPKRAGVNTTGPQR